jgi:hypothetical protein
VLLKIGFGFFQIFDLRTSEIDLEGAAGGDDATDRA